MRNQNSVLDPARISSTRMAAHEVTARMRARQEITMVIASRVCIPSTAQ